MGIREIFPISKLDAKSWPVSRHLAPPPPGYLLRMNLSPTSGITKFLQTFQRFYHFSPPLGIFRRGKERRRGGGRKKWRDWTMNEGAAELFREGEKGKTGLK